MSLTQQETQVLMDVLVRIAKLDHDVLDLQDRCTGLHQEIMALKHKNGLK